MPLQPVRTSDQPMFFSHFSSNRSQNYEIILNFTPFLLFYFSTFYFFVIFACGL